MRELTSEELELYGIDIGIDRRDDETDEEYKNRLLEYLKNSSGDRAIVNP